MTDFARLRITTNEQSSDSPEIRFADESRDKDAGQ